LQQSLFLHNRDAGETRVLSNVEWRDDVKPRQNMVVAELVDEKLEVPGDAEVHTMTVDLHQMLSSCAANKTNYKMKVVKLETKRNIFDKFFSPLGPKLKQKQSPTKPPPQKKHNREEPAVLPVKPAVLPVAATALVMCKSSNHRA
jgi:hypothetical protein